jgi:hypothetical protein
MEVDITSFKPNAKIVWLGKDPVTSAFTQSKKGNQREMLSMTFITKKDKHQVQLVKAQGDWFVQMLNKLSVENNRTYTLAEVKESYEAAGLEDFELFWDNKPVNTMNRAGLLRL